MLLSLCDSAIASTAFATVSAEDGSVSVSVDRATGEIVAITTGGDSTKYDVSASASLEGTIPLQTVVHSDGDGGGVHVSRLMCVRGGDVPCSMQQAWVHSHITPRPTSVGWTVNASSQTDPSTPVPLWSTPIVTNVSFADVGAMQFWAPWERGNKCAALSLPPSCLLCVPFLPSSQLLCYVFGAVAIHCARPMGAIAGGLASTCSVPR
eukprot:SAG31_NODE_14122_length_826_cov_1.140303_2_plen_208_part_00